MQDVIHNAAQVLNPKGLILLSLGIQGFCDEEGKLFPDVEEGEPGWSPTHTIQTMCLEIMAK